VLTVQSRSAYQISEQKAVGERKISRRSTKELETRRVTDTFKHLDLKVKCEGKRPKSRKNGTAERHWPRRGSSFEGTDTGTGSSGMRKEEEIASIPKRKPSAR